MKTTKMFLLFLVVMAVCGVESLVAQSKFHVDVKESILTWIGKKVGGEHSGVIHLHKGVLMMEEDAIVGGSFQIDMTTIKVTDIEKSSSNKKLVMHLKSDDFFSVEKFPIATFKLIEARKMASGNYMVKGNLTIKDITQIMEFSATVHSHGEQMHLMSNMVVDRSKFDVRYGSGSFFSNLGDRMIYDDFELNVNLVLKKE